MDKRSTVYVLDCLSSRRSYKETVLDKGWGYIRYNVLKLSYFHVFNNTHIYSHVFQGPFLKFIDKP